MERLTPAERRAASLEEGLGVSSYEARMRTRGDATNTRGTDTITRPRKRKLTAEISGRDKSRIDANREEREHPDIRTLEERRAANKRGIALARAAIPTPEERAYALYEAELQDAVGDDAAKVAHEAQLALQARLRLLAEKAADASNN